MKPILLFVLSPFIFSSSASYAISESVKVQGIVTKIEGNRVSLDGDGELIEIALPEPITKTIKFLKDSQKHKVPVELWTSPKMILAKNKTVPRKECLGKPLAEGDLTFQGIDRFFKRNFHLKRVNSFLACLPSQFLSRSLLVYESRSASKECVDPENPRVILFNENAGFTMAFNGHQEKPECNIIEMAEFDEAKGQLQMKAIFFSETSSGESTIVSRETQTPTQGGAHLTQVNPKSPVNCSTCHRADPRHIWDTYNQWPGVYGSNEDEFPPTQMTELLKQRSSSREFPPKPLKETQMFMKFLETNRKQGPYQYLIGLEDRLTQQPAIYSDYNGNGNYPNTRTNAAFNQKIQRLNLRRIVRKLMSYPDFEKYKYAYFAAALGCTHSAKYVRSSATELKIMNEARPQSFINEQSTPVGCCSINIDSFLPPEVTRSFKDPVQDFEKSTVESSFQYGLSIESKQRQFHGAENEKFFTRDFHANRGYPDGTLDAAPFRYLLENRGINLGDWSTTFQPGTFSFETGASENRYFAFLLYEKIKPLGKELDAFFSKSEDDSIFDLKHPLSSVSPHRAEICGALRSKSLAAFAPKQSTSSCKIEPSAGDCFQSMAKEMETIGSRINGSSNAGPVPASCVECHLMKKDSNAPEYPFHNEADLKKYIKANPKFIKILEELTKADNPRRMPPSPYPPLTEKERDALIEFVRKVAK